MTHNNIHNIIFSCLSFSKITLMCMELIQQFFLKKRGRGKVQVVPMKKEGGKVGNKRELNAKK